MGPWLRLLRSERNFEGAKIRPLPVEKSSSSVSLVVVESNSDRRFDPNFATHLLLDIAHEQSVENLLQKLILRGMENPQSDLACLQIWLVDKGDLCSVCPQRPKCPDQTRCLHLAAGRGNSLSSSESDARRYDDPNARMPLGVGLVGKVAATAQQLVLNGLNESPDEWGELECL